MGEPSPESQEGLQGVGIMQRPEAVPGRKGVQVRNSVVARLEERRGRAQGERKATGSRHPGLVREGQGFPGSRPNQRLCQAVSMSLRILLGGKGLISSPRTLQLMDSLSRSSRGFWCHWKARGD